jgi:hypothetical protein
MPKKDLPLTYAGCRICGYQPKGTFDRMNFGPVRFWEPDDGWVVGTLCPWCYKEFGDRQPKPDDYAYQHTNDICDVEDTDDDPLLAIG